MKYAFSILTPTGPVGEFTTMAAAKMARYTMYGFRASNPIVWREIAEALPVRLSEAKKEGWPR